MQQIGITTLTRGLFAAVLSLGLAGPALAAEAESETGMDSEQQNIDVSEEQLEQFAAAYGDIQEVRAEYVPKLQEAEGEEEQAKLQEEGQQEMVEAIESNGMDVAEYQEIGQALNSDEELQNRLQELMEEQGQGQGATE